MTNSKSTDIEKNRCRNKKRYAFQSEVPPHSAPYYAYGCRVCQGWHLTSGETGAINKIYKMAKQHKFFGFNIAKNGGNKKQSNDQ